MGGGLQLMIQLLGKEVRGWRKNAKCPYRFCEEGVFVGNHSWRIEKFVRLYNKLTKKSFFRYVSKKSVMGNSMQRLPIGIQGFESLREDGYL